ncbi:neuropilin and tolloid-like protein 1 [Littorina saxatilis]|uniref:neuropilin and tolloid-like protein 1 n=1 Tax=Littorina saxatilis TaxID=31220 RepID=UPI0038B426C1
MFASAPNGVCGTSKPSTNYRTKGNQVTVTLANRGSKSSYVDFELLLTSVYSAGNGSCRSNDFRCNNGLCISNQLVCNNYNDCGDDTDEVEGCTLAAGVIVGIVFGVLVFVGFCTVFGVCVRRRRRTYIRVTETVREYPTVQQQQPMAIRMVQKSLLALDV